MSDYNRAARAYWSVMVLAGALTGVWAFYRSLSFNAQEWAVLVTLVSLVMLTGWHSLRIPGTHASFTAGDAFVFLSVLLLNVPAAVIVGVVDTFVCTCRRSKRAATRLGATAMMSVTVFMSGSLFDSLLSAEARAGHTAFKPLGVPVETLLAGLALMTLAQYLLNGLSVSAMYALRNHRSVWSFWRESHLWTILGFIMAAICAALVYGAMSRFGLVYVLPGVSLLAATYATYRIYFERLNTKTQEASEMGRLHLSTVEALATAIDAKDQTTHCHVRRVQIFAAGMGRVLGLSENEIEALKAGALLHDIGKLAVPDHILNKPGRLTSAEFEKMKVHTTVGAEILTRVNFPYPVVPIVRHHHEQWDGQGYPDGLQGEQIPVTARILSIVDCFDSVREDRPFRRGMTRDEAIALLLRGSGTHFDPQVVELFLENLSRFEEEIAALGLEHHGSEEAESAGGAALSEADLPAQGARNSALMAYDQIKNAHREVYALYEIARTFGSSLNIEDTVSILINKVGHVVPFDTCVVYLHDELKAYATAAHVAGKNAEAFQHRCVAPGEGVTGFALANRRSIHRINPKLDFRGLQLPADCEYRSMAALPLVKDDRLLGALSVYSLELNEYSDDHMRLLETVARLAADALFNAMHHAEAESNAMTDPLTGLPNARSMYLRFEQEASRARRTHHPFQVIMMDLDEFKEVNDTYGHKVGDQMLREVARILQGQLREYDFLARYAGDEFVAIVQELDSEHVEELRQRIEQCVSKFSLRVMADRRARVGISVGAATFGLEGETLDQLLISADQAMYRAKSTHKERKRARHEDQDESIIELDTDKLASTAIN